MSMPAAAALFVGLAALLPACGREETATAGFWFEDVTATTSDPLEERLGGALTPHDLAAIESRARAELRTAFAGFRLAFTDSTTAMYRMRVVDRFRGPRMWLPIAGVARPLPGRRGEGAVNFTFVAGSAAAYAPPGATREAIVDAIGRGIGRTAAHELAHQILGSFPLHNTTDRFSYEYQDLRPEHFYGDVHWGIASEKLRQSLGVAP